MAEEKKTTPAPAFRSFDGYRWEEVPFLPYKEEGSAPFKAISRQLLFKEEALRCEMRYSPMAWISSISPRTPFATGSPLLLHQ